jgi:hypothetical protein
MKCVSGNEKLIRIHSHVDRNSGAGDRWVWSNSGMAISKGKFSYSVTLSTTNAP